MKLKRQKMRFKGLIHKSTKYYPLIILVILYTAAFSFISIQKHVYFATGILDLGHANQILWNTIHGHFFMETSLTGTGLVSRLSDHADFFILLLVPFYALLPSVKTILVIQALSVAIGAIPAFLIGKKFTKNTYLGYTFAVFYLLLPPLENANAFEFHAVVFASSLVLFSFYLLYIKKYWWSLLPTFLVLLTKEEAGFTITLLYGFFLLKDFIVWKPSSYGIYQSIKKVKANWKQVLILLTTAVFTSLYSFILIKLVIPHFMDGGSIYVRNYFGYQDGIIGILLYPLRNPLVVINSQFSYDIHYALELFAPYGFLSILSPFVLLIALPEFLIDFLSTNHFMQSALFQYSALLDPFIFLAFIYGFMTMDRFLKRFLKRYKRIYLLFFVAISLLASSYIEGPLFFDRHYDPTPLLNEQDTREALVLAKNIPANQSISADNILGEHFSSRPLLYIFPINAGSADYIITATKIDNLKGYYPIYLGSSLFVYKKS